MLYFVIYIFVVRSGWKSCCLGSFESQVEVGGGAVEGADPTEDMTIITTTSVYILLLLLLKCNYLKSELLLLYFFFRDN